MEDIKSLLNFGVINIDKPKGPTSFSITDYVRKSLGLNKASHMGTLDPRVTGVLPITLGRACRIASHLIHHDKSYVGILHTHKEMNIKELQKIIDEKFVGRIKQTPPHKSAVKRAERERTVYKFKLIEESENKKDFLFECIVEGGTYIRKICSDIGEIIGGAHMAELRRTKAGIFDEEKIYSLYEFDEAVKEWKEGRGEKLKEMIVPAEEVIRKILPFVEVYKEAVKILHTGKPLLKKGVFKGFETLKNADIFAVFSDNLFIGIYRKEEKDVLGIPLFVKD
jgi:H/ACA ribonucleoprotein complex subunit 4